ncbi:MAG: DJ-1/PfpI family protein [Propionibacteriaceae bacterium]|jgi:transcriptional regulator GlxA family with amidase domain|nr:DJ-1/PfpI family protein [Propionibacteriaceae bacterium]
MTASVGWLVFPGMDMLDFAGPCEVFVMASRIAQRDGEATPFQIHTIAESLEPVTVQGGLTILPHHTIADHPDLDCLILPGGLAGLTPLIDRGDVVDWVTRQAATVPLVASVCTGAFLLAQTGLLAGLKATTHIARTDDLRHRFPEVDVVENHRWVDSGRFVTSAGASAGIDLALHLVERLANRDLSVGCARALDL